MVRPDIPLLLGMLLAALLAYLLTVRLNRFLDEASRLALEEAREEEAAMALEHDERVTRPVPPHRPSGAGDGPGKEET